jgi:hypothetical protein
MIQNGTRQAYGRVWPVYERPAYDIEIVGAVDAESVESAEHLENELREVLDKYGLTVKVQRVLVQELSPEDQAEKNALDQIAIAEYLAGGNHAN